VLVGWAAGDETEPFALAGSWFGGGGLISAVQTFSSSLRWSGPSVVFSGNPVNLGDPLVDVQGDHKTRHDLAGGGLPIITPSGAIAATLLSGGDRMMAVQLVAAGAIAAGTPLFTATYATPWLPRTPMVLGNVSDPLGAPLACAATPLAVVVKMGQVAPPLPAGTYQAILISGG
jgi:hypothetical protein